MDSKTIGNRLANLRKQKSLSQSELALRLSVSNKLISKWECGGAIPDISYLEKYAEIFAVRLEEITCCDCKNDDGNKIKKDNEKTAMKSTQLQIITSVSLIISFFPYAVAVLAHGFLPSQIPMHYNSAGEITRWGSAVEMLALGAFLSLIPVLTVVITSKVKIKDNERMIKTVFILCGGGMAVVFLVLQIVFTVSALKAVETIKSVDFVKLLSTAASLLFAFLGIGLYYIKQNPILGLRISTTMQDPINWVKTHRLASPCFVVCGVVSAFLCAITKGFFPMFIMAAAFIIAVIIPVVYSIRLGKNAK